MPACCSGGPAVAKHDRRSALEVGTVGNLANAEVEPYMAAKATVRFPPDQPLSVSLIEKLLKVRLKENEQTEKPKGVKP